MSQSLAELRHEYSLGVLTKAKVDSDPIRQFQRWLDEAINAQLPEPNALTLATADRTGRPFARVVLLKDCNTDGFAFYTNYRSDKGQQLAENPHAALVFVWLELERQVRVEGMVSKVLPAESEIYFRSRPRESRLGALASRQSQVVANRQVLEERYQQLADQYPDDNIPMPNQWGGYRLKPEMIEFWQGRHGRMHDRLRYRLQKEGEWLLERLEP
ncbi:MAG TPA: pyridoxamine 5'-phosphate oxidase [Candidatus Competibacteraceae bacterium]|nr:pyridoxamine 5'-phosphate oxidase [Candidatus Competibacteraceae bacterium]MCP5133819.1 pyridoxamine 5'-phosphate oxidase [Gammaproteobacteria bacterium]HPF58105.1 pyridoxamine 5'-phosphate oxidase [Candidatus Competibacteraceae bacterium]HRY18364.1 pyridoxamine 5'-phosphate oxidase [Candidatus Competibacteraceae bacterium]